MSVNVYGQPSGVQIPVNTDFRQNQTASARLRFRRIAPEGNNASLAVGASTQDVSWRFGAGFVLNLAETRLRIFEYIKNSDASNAYYVRALPPIQALRLQTSSGVVLIDIQNFDAYMATVYPYTHKRANIPREAVSLGESASAVEGVASLDFWAGPYQAATVGTAPAYGGSFPMPGSNSTFLGIPIVTGGATNVGSMTPGGPLIFPNKQDLNATDVDIVGPYINIAYPSPNAYIESGSTQAVSYNASVPFVQSLPRQYIPVALGTSSAFVFQWDMPLRKLLPHTMCAALQDLYFGTDLLLTVTLATQNARAFTSVGQTGDAPDVMAACNAGSITQVSASGSTYATSYGTTTLASTKAPTTDIYLQDMLLATQDNLDLVNSVKQEIATKGIRIPTQQVFMSIETATAPSSAAVSYSRTIRLNIARGAALLKWYTGWLVTSTSTSHAMVTRMPGNQVGKVWQLYRAFLNAVPMTDGDQSPWDQHSRVGGFYVDSLCPSFLAWCQLSGMCVEDFTTGFDLQRTTPEGGLPLANPIDIQINWTYGTTCTCSPIENVFLAVMLRYLSISPAGVTYESV